MDKVRYGIIGIGKQGGGYAAALAKGKDKNAVLAAVCDVDKVKLVNAARDWGVKTYENYEELIKSGEVDAVIIDTPHYLHPVIGIAALEEGLHVLSDKPIGVNVMLLNPNAEEVAKIVVEEGVQVVTTGAGSPAKFMDMWKKAGVKVIPVVASVAMAKMMERAGADAVVAEGMESGGHIGSATTMTLVPQVVDAVNIPVVAAGGIADGRGFAASFMLGAQGVQMGTRFVVAKESIVHENYKQKVIKARDIDSEVTGMSTGHPVRQIRNKMTREYLKLEKEGAPFEELEYLTLGSLRKAVMDGDVVNGTVMAGQCAGLVTKEQTCKEIIEEVVRDGCTLLKTDFAG